DNKGIVDFIVDQLDSDKAEDIQVIDLEGKTEFAKYMVIATGTSSRHVKALSSKLSEELKREIGFDTIRIEGAEKAEWMLLDAGDIIINIFKPETRATIDMESIWKMEFKNNDF
ncbi:UNVERIFIED_CONTAM: hypothetical protein GTU68_016289, partial [Idotea baltica]|nr:hypothetical protein [Idotea baltica]